MEEFAEQEKLKDYQNRVSDWIGSQGVFFQLRYASTIGAGSIMRQLGSVLAKMAIILVLVAGIGYFMLQRHFKGESYEAKIKGEIEKALGVSDIEVKNFSRSRGNGGFHNIVLEGGPQSFFYDAKIDEFKAPFAYLDGLTTKWKPDSFKMRSAEFSLKAGGSTKEMETAYSTIVDSLKEGDMSSILIEDFSCDWGYSKMTYGGIRNSKFQAEREDGKWNVVLTGGNFQQNWLHDFEITEGRLKIDESGIEVVSLSLRQGQGQGSLALSGTIGTPLEKPKFTLSGAFNDLAVEKLIQVPGVTVREFVEGRISGDLMIGGSTNSRIEISGSASPSAGNSLTIREQWPILKAISIMDTQRSFRRVDFSEGSFNFATADGGLELSDLTLISRDKAMLKGEISTRLPSQEDVAKILGIALTDGFSSDSTDRSAAQKMEDDRMSLSDAMRLGKRVDDLNLESSRADSNPKDSEAQMNAKELQGLRLREQMEIHLINGKLELAIPTSSFAENEKLAKIYPENSEGWRWIPIPLRDVQFTQISEEANAKILKEARRRSSGLVE